MSFITRYPQKETATTVQAAAAAPTAPVNYAPPSHSSAKSRVQITSEAASRTIQHLVASQFQLAGFDSADKDAMEYLESLVVECQVSRHSRHWSRSDVLSSDIKPRKLGEKLRRTREQNDASC